VAYAASLIKTQVSDTINEEPRQSRTSESYCTNFGQNFIESQEELLQLLSDKGFELTRATLSRDFREMKVAKTPDAACNYFYRLPGIMATVAGDDTVLIVLRENNNKADIINALKLLFARE